MTQNNTEHVSWPPESTLTAAQEAVWSEYVGRVVLPAITIWDNMTTYLQDLSPKTFVLYYSRPKKVKTQWEIERREASHEPTGRTLWVSALIEAETPLSALPASSETEAALQRLTELSQYPDPRWQSYHGKVSVPASALLQDHPAFLLPVAQHRDILDLRMQADSVYGDREGLLRGMVGREYSIRHVREHELDVQVSKNSPYLFRPLDGVRNLREELDERQNAGDLTLPESDLDATRTAIEGVLRGSLPWYLGDSLKELEQARLALSGQVQENPQL